MIVHPVDPLLETSCMDHPFLRQDLMIFLLNKKLDAQLKELQRLQEIHSIEPEASGHFWMSTYMFIKHKIHLLIDLIRFILGMPVVNNKIPKPPGIDLFI